MEKSRWSETVEWDIETWKRAFEFWELEINWTGIERALEIGARKGGPSRWLAQKGIEVDCTDRKNTLSTAGAFQQLDKSNLKISFFDLDVLDLQEIEKYDLIICKSVLGGVGHHGQNQKISQAISNIHQALKPGGVFLFAENLESSPIHRVLRKKLVRWGEGWNYIPFSQLKVFFDDFSECKINTTGFLSTFGRSEKQRTILAKIDRFILPIIPQKWNYLGYGIAKKEHEH